MKDKIKEKTEKLQQIVNQVNQGKNQIAQLEQEAIMIQGELRILAELDAEKEADKPKEE